MPTDTTTISETVSKKQRGRPRRFSRKQVEDTSAFTPDVKSARGKQNAIYRMIALHQILRCSEPKRYSWLADEDGMRAGTGEWKPTLLTELGRISDELLFFDVAEQLCKHKPTTKHGLRYIARVRHGQSPPNCLTLSREIARLIEEYRQRFPEISDQFVRTALENAEGLTCEDAQDTDL